MTLFGPSLDDLTLEDLKSYLDLAEDESLLWEAKGTELHKSEVRRQVCGFANSHEGGYLILGVSKSMDAWEPNGVAFPDEPATWLSNVVSDPERGVRPRPDFDVKALSSPHGHVAVLRVRPTSTPPCMTNGVVYERTHGKTVTVSDPVRLAALFSRGDQARRAARDAADRAARLALESLPEVEEDETQPDLPIRFAVGVAATGSPSDVASRLFQEALATEYWQRLRDLPTGMPPGFGHAPHSVEWSQTALVWRRRMTGAMIDYDIALTAAWDGTAAVAERVPEDGVYLDSLVEHRVGPAWRLADEVVGRLRGFGDFYVTVLFTGGRFPRRRQPAHEFVTMRRGPMVAGVDTDQLASLGRELMRSVGSPEPEPPIREGTEDV